MPRESFLEACVCIRRNSKCCCLDVMGVFVKPNEGTAVNSKHGADTGENAYCSEYRRILHSGSWRSISRRIMPVLRAMSSFS
jgi:hypothetical protein